MPISGRRDGLPRPIGEVFGEGCWNSPPGWAPVASARKQQQAGTRRLAAEALAIEAEDARSAGALGFMARILVQVGLPHSEPSGGTFLRRNGDLTFCITAHPDIGLPYGRYPRLFLIWRTGEAVRTRSPRLHLGPTLSGFMAELGLIPAGGRWGTIGRLRDQMKRLLSSTIAYTYDASASGEWHDTGFRVAEETHLWWRLTDPGQVAAGGPRSSSARASSTASSTVRCRSTSGR